MSETKKHALITGATAGIGEAIAKALAAEGFTLTLTGRREERLAALKAELVANANAPLTEADVHTLAFDIRNNAALESALATLPCGGESITVLVNNAGLVQGLDLVHQSSVEDWETMLDTNVKGLLQATRAVVPSMVARRHGHIINVGSIAGRIVYPKATVYCATKHAVHAISEGLRAELVGTGVRITTIEPGAVETEFSDVRFKGDKERAKKVYEGFKPLVAEDIASAVVYAVQQPAHVTIESLLITPTDYAPVTNYSKGNVQ